MATDLMKSADVFIAAVGRSGSTMLANLLTTPPGRWVAIEPRFANWSTGRDLLEQLRSMGVDVDDCEWPLRSGESHEERVRRTWRARSRGSTSGASRK